MKTTITLFSPSAPPLEIEADVIGGIAVHMAPRVSREDPPRFTGWIEGEWEVSHVATGRLIAARLSNKTTTTTIRRLLRDLPIDWVKAEFTPEELDLARAIVRPYWERKATP